MVNKIYNINLDLRRVTAQAESIPPVVDGDNGNIFVITLTDDGAPVNLSGCKVVCAFSKTDGSTVEQDTEDADVYLDEYGIATIGTPEEEDTITVNSTGTEASVAVSGTGISSATVNTEKFLEKFPEAGEYEFVYFGTSWMYGMHSVVIGGTNHNVLTVFLKTGSFGVGKNNCELQIYTGTVLVTTAQFNFDGRKGIVNADHVKAEDKYPLLVSLINQAANALALALPFTHPSTVTNTVLPDDPANVSVDVDEQTQSTEWTFDLPAPNSITSIVLISGDHSAGTFDTYRISFTNGTHLDFQVWNGTNGIGSVISVNGQTGVVTLAAADVGAVPTTREVNGHALSSDVTVEADDIPTDSVGVSVQSALNSRATVSLFTASIGTTWTGADAPFSQTVSISGIKATDSPVVDLVPSSTYATAETQLEDWGKIFNIESGANQITVYATEQTTVALPIRLLVVR